MKKEKIYNIGKTLGISENEIQKTLKRNKNRILSGFLVAGMALIIGNRYFLGNHYVGASIQDFDFLMRFFF